MVHLGAWDSFGCEKSQILELKACSQWKQIDRKKKGSVLMFFILMLGTLSGLSILT